MDTILMVISSIAFGAFVFLLALWANLEIWQFLSLTALVFLYAWLKYLAAQKS